MKVLEGNPSALYVGDYDGEENQGIGRDFYLNTLPAVAKQLGFRFITGANNGKNISFFLQTLGRFTYNDIKPEFRNALFPNANPQSSDIDLWTVQFVNQEDIAEYVIPRESL